MLTVQSPVFFLVLLALSAFTGIQAAPQRNGNGGGRTGQGRNRGGGGGGRGGKAAAQTPQQQAAQIAQGISQATDGSTILDTTARVNGLDLRFKISGPADQFTAASGVQGATQTAGAQGAMGLNVLLHGDGGQSFFDFPNQAVQGNLMGVVILAPSENLLWGQTAGPPSGLQRDDGAEHSLAVNDLIQNILPQVAAFNASNIFFTGVSGGSLTLSGFFMPAHMANFAGNGVLLMCGALPPQVDVADGGAFLANTKVHFQSTQQELSDLQAVIPQAISAFEQLGAANGLNDAALGALQTVDNTPNGGHCEFDEQGFVSGIQLISDNFANIMQGGNGAVKGINVQTVLTPVVGNENVQFGPAQKRDTLMI